MPPQAALAHRPPSSTEPIASPLLIRSPHFPVSDSRILHHGSLLLGGLWLLQGTGIPVIAPIACVAQCETLTGPSRQWALTGAIALAAGAGLVWWSRFRGRS